VSRTETPVNATERLRSALADPDAFATTLLLICLDRFGTECLSDPDDPGRGPWHPLVFRDEIRRKFGVVVPSENIHRLMAAITIVTTDLFTTDVKSFIPLANVLAGDDFDPHTWDPADSVECAWAITEYLLLDPPDEDGPEPFSEEIRLYIGRQLREEGFVTAPDVLRIAVGLQQLDLTRIEFADDPEMFSAMHQNQADKTAEVEDAIKEQLTVLRNQLHALPLQNGDTAEVVKRLDELLSRRASSNSE
jgi:hypothetical protein